MLVENDGNEEEDLDDDEEKMLVGHEQTEANELSDNLETTADTTTTTLTTQNISYNERERWHKENDDGASKRSSNTSIISHPSSNKFVILETLVNGLMNGGSDTELDLDSGSVAAENDNENDNDLNDLINDNDNDNDSEQKLLNDLSNDSNSNNIKDIVLIQLDNDDDTGFGLNGNGELFTKFDHMGW
jgi:hypothetical protein